MENIFQHSKIKYMQLDPFGFCNAKCWFCPVRYFPQPEEGSGVMSIELMEKIFQDLTNEKNRPDGVVDPNFQTIASSHYNEILLYKHFEQFLELLRKYKFKTLILSNGVSLTKQRTDLIKNYLDVVYHVGLNIPAFEKELWAKRAGFSEDQFDRMIGNVSYAFFQLRELRSNFRIGINGLNRSHIDSGYLTKGPEFDEMNYDLHPEFGEHQRQFELAQKMFPRVSIEKTGLYDRAGSIDHIMTNKPFLQKLQDGKKVVGCNNWGDRSLEWLNVNSAGSVFLCCNDYAFDYKFGDLTKQSIREVWLDPVHQETVYRARTEICTHCFSAKLA
jgi:sulfatase maturation enzyme AslB (radical SAM superfamily)